MGESRGNSGGIRPPTDEKKPDCLGRALFSNTLIYLIKLVRPAGFEPTTPWFVAKYSIQLSYGRKQNGNYIQLKTRRLGPAIPQEPRC
uniref:Uncharacterized protein n=1 Tax=mine drainage metagenome TaxID=410659 RepID=E6PNX5_9ZZZZ